MSSDGYFDGEDDFDASALQQLDAIEAAHFSPRKPSPHLATSPIIPPTTASKRPPLGNEASFGDISFDFDETNLAQLDNFIEDAIVGKAQPVAGPSKPTRTASGNMLQRTLFGDVLPPPPTNKSTGSNNSRSQMAKTKSVQNNLFGQQAPKTKSWDHTAFSKTGVRQSKQRANKKGKGKACEDDAEDSEEQVEFEQFPAPFVNSGWPPPMKLTADLLETKHWIYPINFPKRDYQFNIVKNCLFDNTLVALPTGLGKTFIAGVVMLNFYRWFPEGKVVFVAPTKPLVAQQVSACHETCGIPGRDSIELTGEVPKHIRARYWAEKRVFFMTPQTLVNDLLKSNCDVRDIILLVVDEAHRATGDYAYNQAIRFLMAKNPHFRVLALTATPGNRGEAVQLLVDGLHISRIEIRDEQSLDLKPYIHKKIFKPHIIKANEELAKVRDLLVKVMEPFMKPVQRAQLLFPSEMATSLHPYRPQMIMTKLLPHQRGLFTPLSMLGKLARAMLYLLTGSFTACYTYLQEISTETPSEDDNGKKKKGQSQKFKDDPNFRALMQELEMQRSGGFKPHPKIEKLKTILIQHFGSKISDEGGEDNDDTKVMVFSSYRGVVDEIVQELDKERPLIRAARFIGQGVDKQGNKGLAQKDQLEVIKKFKAGEYNVLVATCIGEEGLDIGAIDITVCYDSDKAPTRMVQRFGRTGRKREGTIHALLAEGREEENINKAGATYKEVQKVVNQGQIYELYGDVERLIPDHIKPECVEKKVEIEEYVREEKSKQNSPRKGQGVKRKRNDDVARNIPEGTSTGFVSVRDLVVKGAKKRKKTPKAPKDFDACGEDDETDEEIASGRVLTLPRRTQSAAAAEPASKPASKGKLKKSATIGSKAPPKPRKKKEAPKVAEPSLSQFSKQGADDSDDMDIEQGTVVPSAKSQPRHTLSPTEPSPKKMVDDSIIDLSDSDHGQISPTRSHRYRSPSRESPPPEAAGNMDDEENMGWLVDDDDDNLNFEIVDSSPEVPTRTVPFERMEFEDDSIEISAPVSSKRNFDAVDTSDPFETLVDDSVEIVEADARFEKSIGGRTVHSSWSPSSTTHILSPPLLSSRKSNTAGKTNPAICPPSTSSKPISSPTWNLPSSPLYPEQDKSSHLMLPPATLPKRFMASPNNFAKYDAPEPSHPIRPVGYQPRRRRIPVEEAESPALELPPPSQRRLHRMESTPIRPKSKDKKKDKFKRAKPSLLGRNVNPIFDGEAAHSGDDVSEGYSNSEDDMESESDRLFIKDSPATQVSQSYDQSMMYRRGLLTQAPSDGPAFVAGPSRPKPFGRIDGPERRNLPSSSPPPPDEDLDHYEFGTFVVPDDEEISYEQDMSSYL